MKQNDQYGNPIPQDLTFLDISPVTLTEEEIKKLNGIDWYCFEGNKTNHIFVSQSKLEEILNGLVDNLPPDDIIQGFPLARIDSVLYRWNETDGFYWA